MRGAVIVSQGLLAGALGAVVSNAKSATSSVNGTISVISVTPHTQSASPRIASLSRPSATVKSTSVTTLAKSTGVAKNGIGYQVRSTKQQDVDGEDFSDLDQLTDEQLDQLELSGYNPERLKAYQHCFAFGSTPAPCFKGGIGAFRALFNAAEGVFRGPTPQCFNPPGGCPLCQQQQQQQPQALFQCPLQIQQPQVIAPQYTPPSPPPPVQVCGCALPTPVPSPVPFQVPPPVPVQVPYPVEIPPQQPPAVYYPTPRAQPQLPVPAPAYCACEQCVGRETWGYGPGVFPPQPDIQPQPLAPAYCGCEQSVGETWGYGPGVFPSQPEVQPNPGYPVIGNDNYNGEPQWPGYIAPTPVVQPIVETFVLTATSTSYNYEVYYRTRVVTDTSVSTGSTVLYPQETATRTVYETFWEYPTPTPADAAPTGPYFYNPYGPY